MKLFLTALAIALPAAAQLEVYVVQGTVERPVSGLVAMGTTPAGEPLDVAIRLKNPAGAPLAVINTLTIQGPGFSLFRAPTPPVGLVGGFSLDFFVRYVSGTAAEDARANLRINSATLSFVASATAAPFLYVMERDGTRTRKLVGETTVFGTVERGDRVLRQFVLENGNATPLTVQAMTVTGDSFTLDSPPVTQIPARDSRTFSIAFQPVSSGVKSGVLTIDGRRYLIEGLGKDPPLPKPTLIVGPEIRQSAKQVKISVGFDAPARAEGAGRVRVEFTPAMAGPDDAAVLLLTTNSRSVPFSVKTGESQALFGSQRETLLQTGTTAGTLRLVAEMGGFSTEATYTIAPAAVVVDQITVRRGVGALELAIRGFDNSRSAAEAAFTFFDTNGQPVAPGEMRANVADAFRRYFESTASGGMFALSASFPATGNTTAVASATIEIRNSAGVFRSEKYRF